MSSIVGPTYGQDYGQDVNVPFNPDESVFDPTYGGSLPNYLRTDDDTVPTVRSGGGSSRSIGGGSTSDDRSDLTNAINDLFGSNLSGKDIAARAAVLGGGLAGGLGALSSGTQKVGYQGGIPKFTAERNMVTAPSAGSRPGAGGVDYGGNVNYVRQPGSPSTSSGGGGGGSSAIGNIAKVAGGAGLAALLANYLGKSGSSGNIASILKRIGGGSSGGSSSGGSRSIGGGGGGGSGPNGELTTPEGEYAGADEFTGIDEQIAANENALQEPPLLNDEEVEAEFDRLRGEIPDYEMPEYIEPPSFDWADASTESYYGYAKGGNVDAPRYLQGETDGMADKIPARIGEDQPAALSHGEFVVPADVVSHLGNGNSDAGAKKLYSMMDKIREARTGTKKQGRRINPDSFMPGGLASAYANGGSVKYFATGGTTMPSGSTGSEQTLAGWTGDYIPNILGKAEALASAPYQQYRGPLTAGVSDLQQQAFKAGSNLSVPGSVGAAAQTAGDIASKAQNMSYSPTQFANQFNAPAAYTPSGAPQYDKLAAKDVTSTYQAPTAYTASGAPQYNQLSADTVRSTFIAPEAYKAGEFKNEFKAPNQYQNTEFKSDTFGQNQAQQYMNPYLQASLNPQLEEARRQSAIIEQANKAAMTKAGAFGGGRSAILAAENQRNLGSNLANITGKGYDTAFQNAMAQFNQDQARNIQAQQASEQSKQFGASQAMTAADMQAKYGLSAQQAQEASRQFGASQALQAATTAGSQGLQAALANQQSRLTAGQGNINAAMEAARQAEASRQFGYGQSAQQAQTAAQLGLQAQQANQQAGLTAGQGNINAAMEAARQQEQSRQFGANQGMTAAQQAAQYGQAAQTAAEQSRQFGANLGLQGLQAGLQAAQAQGNLGISSGQLGLAQLQQQAALGAQQRGIEAEGIAADKAAFEQARENPYKMLQFQQSMLQGLPISATNYSMPEQDWLTKTAGGATTVNKLLETLGLLNPTATAPAAPKK